MKKQMVEGDSVGVGVNGGVGGSLDVGGGPDVSGVSGGVSGAVWVLGLRVPP